MKRSKGLKIFGILLALLAVASLLTACGIGRPALVGIWNQNQSTTTFEFTEAGKLIFTNPATPHQEVDYQFQNDNTLKLADGTIITFTIQADTLTLNVGGQQDIVLTRAR